MPPQEGRLKFSKASDYHYCYNKCMEGRKRICHLILGKEGLTGSKNGWKITDHKCMTKNPHLSSANTVLIEPREHTV